MSSTAETEPPPPPTAVSLPDRVPAETWALGVVIAIGGFMTALTGTVVGTGLPTLAAALHATPGTADWVATAYLIAFAAGIPVTGWVARRIGPRRLWLSSLTLFTAMSVACALATGITTLIVCRVVEGLAGGFLVPAGQAILAAAAGPKRVGRVMSVVGIPVVLAPILGPTAGALLLHYGSWPWLFWVNVPFGLLGLLGGRRLLPKIGAADAGPLDLAGTFLVVVSLPLLTYGAARIGSAGSFSDVLGLAAILGALVLLGAFVWRELRTERPLLDLRLFANIPYACAGVTLFCLGIGLFGPLLIMPQYFQEVRGQGAVWAGLALLPEGVGAVLALPIAGRITDRVGGGRVVTAGLAVSSLATIAIALFGADTAYLWMETVLFALGFGIALASAPAMAAAFAVIEPSAIPHATPQLNMLQRTGSSFGSALLTVTLTSQLLDAGNSLSRKVNAFSSTNWLVTATTVFAIIPAVLLLRAETRLRRART